MKIIAHGIKSLPEAQNAIQAGVDFLEIDVSKRVFFNKFTVQHNGLMGIFGLGPILETLLTAEVRSRAFLDLKPVSYRNSFTRKLAELLLKLGIKNAKICGHNWQLISALCEKTNSKPFYTIKDKYSAQRLKIMLPHLKKPSGFSVRHDLIDKDFVEYCSRLKVENFSLRSKNKMAGFEIFAWTVNDLKEVRRLGKLGIDGIITDEWRKLLN